MTHKVVFMFLCVTAIFVSCKQVEDIKKSGTGSETNTQLPFPDSWAGNYGGTLEIFNGKGKAQEVPMELHIAPTEVDSVFKWVIIYGEDKEKGKRDYRIIKRNPEAGIYVTDELNSIVLEDYFLGGKLISRFAVGKSLLLATYEKIGSDIHFEILSGKKGHSSETGGENDTDEIPKVYNYLVNVRQKAILKPIK